MIHFSDPFRFLGIKYSGLKKNNLLRLHSGKIPVPRINNFANPLMFTLCELTDIPFGERLKTKRPYDQHVNNYSIPHKFLFLILYVQIAPKYLKYSSDLFWINPVMKCFG